MRRSGEDRTGRLCGRLRRCWGVDLGRGRGGGFGAGQGVGFGAGHGGLTHL